MIKNKGHWVYGSAVVLALLGAFKYTMQSKQIKSNAQIEFSLL